MKLIITIKQLPNFPAYGTILHKSELKILLGISESTYKRRKDDGTLKPRIFCGQEYFYLSDIKTELDRPEDNEESKADNKLKDSIIDNNRSKFCLQHRPVVPQQCAIEGCNHDVEGNQLSNVPLQRPIKGNKAHKEGEQLDIEPPISANKGIQRQVEGEHPDNFPLHCHNEDIQGHVKRDQCHVKGIQRDAEGGRRPIEGAECSTEGQILPYLLVAPLVEKA